MDESNLPPKLRVGLNRCIGWIESVLLISITLSTIAAIGEEFYLIYQNGYVSLSDILLLFIYLEILAMVHQYASHGKLPVRYPIYIAVIAIARYIILGMKEMDSSELIMLSVAILILTASTTIMRIGHHYWPYNKMPEEK
ncbi:Protein PsiE [Sinobacterium norvegicum]|uniref:Protein PsiE n=1 Tax=Sinobacterium norvegicum TaxID=1641715 RepID=A0ABM9AEH7_9GAMM|nr:phosphate-starvation-inducible PsiE family protein [Sinobacterium norvegicum]CAH0991598.1 Protein PsiE [Sinobacterium norvegicum]